jgi:hypothetical protein
MMQGNVSGDPQAVDDTAAHQRPAPEATRRDDAREMKARAVERMRMREPSPRQGGKKEGKGGVA